MGLFDDLLGKEAISQLKAQLSEKVAEVEHAESEIVKIKGALSTLKVQLTDTVVAASARESKIASLKKELEENKLEKSLQASEMARLKSATLEQKAQSDRFVSALEASVAQAKAEAIAVGAAYNGLENELRETRKLYDEKDRLYQERELNLAEKSGKLIKERQRFQQQAADFHSREQHWKNNIEPQLRKYEIHLSLDTREQQLNDLKSQLEELAASLESQEADMVRRQCTDDFLRAREAEVSGWNQLLATHEAGLQARSVKLDAQHTEQEERAKKLEVWALELMVFRDRADQLDAESERLEEKRNLVESKEAANRAKNSERLADLSQQRSALRKLESQLDQRESNLKTREKEIKREESKIATIKSKNVELRKERKKFAEVVSTIEESKKESVSELVNISRNEKVLSWLIESGDPDATKIENGWLGSTGHGPWGEQLFKASLEEVGYQFYAMSDDDLEYIVVGRNGWSKTDLLAQIEAREGRPLRIYSQEMFFAKLAVGRDPFESGDAELLAAFAGDHPALQFLMSIPDPWPTVVNIEPETVVIVGSEDFGVKEAPLHIMGYRAGKSGLSDAERRKILTDFFESRELKFSSESNDAYIAKWGRGGGAQRLYRMAAHIKYLAYGPNGRDSRKAEAQSEWIGDLKWLKEKYFANYKTKFSWPGV